MLYFNRKHLTQPQPPKLFRSTVPGVCSLAAVGILVLIAVTLGLGGIGLHPVVLPLIGLQ